ncbi:MAG: SpoIIE family protein phosphatase [Candidatus Eremiobacteraeota bacterium]|nr:SpoIIE family protein phosphatase [Candidatus Eremiobacteraeota bacterium]
MIVDDAPENIRLLMGFLGKMCSVQAATSGPKALEFARMEPRPDLILLDVVMPGLSGYEVCEELKRDPATLGIPVIFVTGLNDVDDEKRGLALGAVDYISKPFHAELVRARVSNQLELKRHRDHLEREIRQRTDELVAAQRIQQRLQSELDVASRLQRSMLPEPLVGKKRPSEFALATYLQAARAVGGDLFDHFELDGRRLLFLVGDVSDKGIPAALFMVQVRTLLRSLASRSTSPEELLVQLNEELCRDNQACMFVTVVCGFLHLDSGAMQLARGGHEHPLLVEATGQVRFLEFEGGPALGLCPGADFPSFSMTLGDGDLLALYTDGVTEAANLAYELYGEERLLEVLGRSCDQDPDQMMDALKTSLADFVCEAEPSDDITVLLLRKSPSVTGYSGL